MAAESNVSFLIHRVRRFPRGTFATCGTGRIYARFEAGQLRWRDPEALANAGADGDVRIALKAITPDILKTAPFSRTAPKFLEPNRFHTIGRWGDSHHASVVHRGER